MGREKTAKQWPLVLGLVILGLAIGAFYLALGHQSEPPSVLGFVYSVSGCANSSGQTKSLGPGEEVKPEIIVKGNNIIYHRAINHLCCRKVNISYDINGNEVRIYEEWYGEPCKCICFSELKANLTLSPGSYNVSVYTRNFNPGENKDELVVSKEVVAR